MRFTLLSFSAILPETLREFIATHSTFVQVNLVISASGVFSTHFRSPPSQFIEREYPYPLPRAFRPLPRGCLIFSRLKSLFLLTFN